MESKYIAIIIAVITIILFISNKMPMSVVAMGSSVAMGILIPEMELKNVYSGFSAPGWPMVVGMLIVSNALFETGVAQRIGVKISNSFLAKNERLFIIAVAIICTIMSALMSNNGTVAIWMPLIAVVATASKGKIRSKIVIFVAGTAAVIGGACSLLGSTSQLAANAVLQSYEGYESGLGVFEMTKFMFPVAVVQIIYWATIGYTILKKVLKPESPDFNKGNAYAFAEDIDFEETNNSEMRKKGNIVIFTMLLCIVLFVISGFAPFNKFLNIGVIGMLGAVIVLATKCVDLNAAYAELPWDVLITIGGIGGLGKGLEVSGGGALIANGVLNLFGGESAPVGVLTIAIIVLVSVLTNFMSNNATAAMIAPIAIEMSLALGISPIPWIAIIAACSNFAIATSYGTAVNMQILPAGYKFSDYVYISGPLLIILIITAVIATKFVYPF